MHQEELEKVHWLLAGLGLEWSLHWGSTCLLPSSGPLAPFHSKREAPKHFPFLGNSSLYSYKDFILLRTYYVPRTALGAGIHTGAQ